MSYLRSRKGVRAGRRTTWIGLTGTGREPLREHVAALRQLIDVVDRSSLLDRPETAP